MKFFKQNFLLRACLIRVWRKLKIDKENCQLNFEAWVSHLRELFLKNNVFWNKEIERVKILTEVSL